MITCNKFNVVTQVLGDTETLIHYFADTDLPSGTEVIVNFRRSYKDRKLQECIWIGGSHTAIVLENGTFEGEMKVGNCDKEGLRNLLSLSESGYQDISGKVGDEVELLFVLGARQKNKGFGRYNSLLEGALVQEDGGVRFVEVKCVLLIPMSMELQP